GDRPAPAPAAPPPVTAADVVGRPAPEPVTATSAWEATMEGRGECLRLYAPVVAVGGLRHTTVRVTSPDPRPLVGSLEADDLTGTVV
ncbi:MAG TPA: hypothetical protein VM263_08600, partial [Acidimicrobiales bacterium]|nr:hypothetical protein [Acidimicrobiales bacterium]